MNRRMVLLVLATFQLSVLTLFGQESITGRVVDKSGQPIDAAAVYINGSSLRTTTTSNGTFELKGMSFPCQLVVSYLGFETLNMRLEGPLKMPLLLYLKEKDISLSEVSVEGKDQRKQIIQSFRDYFLGWDVWGKNANILNESSLEYQVSYNEDSASTSFSGDLRRPNLPRAIINRTLVVKAKEPLQVDLPLLGYTVTVDLDYLSLIQTRPYYDPATSMTMGESEISRYVASYYVTPYENVSKSKQRRYERNRKEAYYNSRMHFCQSLLNKELLKNGYLLLEKRRDPKNGDAVYDWVNLDSCTRYDGKGNLQLIGLAGKKFEIHYFGQANGTPVDMSGKKYSDPIAYAKRYRLYYVDSNCSTVFFINDTCTIRSNGLVPDNSISFSGKNNQKKVGATLPDDYTPPKE